MDTNTNKLAEEPVFSLDDLQPDNTASKGQRFLNYLIDITTMIFLNFLFNLAFLLINREAAMEYFYAVRSNLLFRYLHGNIFLFRYLQVRVLFLIYYTICEGAFKGKTLGKLITKTKAVGYDGSPLTFKYALLRSLTRVVPFESLSGFGFAPWHDSWTGTTVVKVKD